MDEIIVMRDTWPGEEAASGYTDAPPTQHAISRHAPFERPLQVIGEVRYRLRKTGSDGRELGLMIENKRIYQEFSSGAKWALGYCSGWNRKRRSYLAWVSDKKYQKAERTLSFNRDLTKH